MLTILGIVCIIIGISIMAESAKTRSSAVLLGILIMLIGSGMLSAVASM